MYFTAAKMFCQKFWRETLKVTRWLFLNLCFPFISISYWNANPQTNASLRFRNARLATLKRHAREALTGRQVHRKFSGRRDTMVWFWTTVRLPAQIFLPKELWAITPLLLPFFTSSRDSSPQNRTSTSMQFKGRSEIENSNKTWYKAIYYF